MQGDDFTVIALPDTQNYTSYSANWALGLFQTAWIDREKTNLNIKMVMHLGDTVNNATWATDWEKATSFMNRLGADVPNLISPGNHDYEDGIPTNRDLTSFNSNFPSTRYTGASWFNGALANVGVSENVYHIDGDFLFMALESEPSAATKAWASGILTANASKLAILSTHIYLNVDNSYLAAGQTLWDDLIKNHDNIIAVLSGHMDEVADHAGYRVDNSLGGQPVHQIQCDYQDWTNGGNAYLRVMRFVPSTRKIYIETYSPYLESWVTDSENEFNVTY